MTYAVEVSNSSLRAIDLYIHYLRVEKQVPDAAARMLGRISRAVDSLQQWPRRCPLAPEDQYRDYEIRMKLVGSSLLLFTIDDDSLLVTIIGFRHSSQLPNEDMP